MRYRPLLALALLASLHSSSTWAGDSQTLETSVCDLSANPGNFEGREVVVRGHIHAGMEITNLSDPRCPGAMIQLTVGEGILKHRDIRRFEKGIRTRGMAPTATAIGRFRAKAHVYPYPMPAIELHAVRQVMFEAK